MSDQKILDVLNNTEIFERNGGEDPYLLVEITPENEKAFNEAGVSTETLKRYGDDTTFCLLALALGEGFADEYNRGTFIKRDKGLSLPLASGHTVDFFNHEGKTVVGLVNSNHYCISELTLTAEEKQALRDLLN